ncbi:MAG: PAC2 family protein [Pseudomonadota bacterium]
MMTRDQYQRETESAIKLYNEPELRNPCMIAAWPGMGNVALKGATYLREKLKAEELGVINPSGFFQSNVVFIRNNLIEEIKLPENKFYYKKNEGLENDILFFIGEAQPLSGKEYEFANIVLDVAERFKVKRVYTFAAFAIDIHYKEKPKVWGVATSNELLEELEKYSVLFMNDGHIGGMNGVILGVAKERGMEGVCLLGEMPYYATQIENPRSSQVVLEIFTKMLRIKIDMTELEILARYTEGEIEKFVLKIEELKLDQILKKDEDKGPGYVH